MEYKVIDGAVVIDKPDDFNPELIFECGQCFRWSLQDDGSWLGIAMGRVLALSERDGRIWFRCSEEDFLSIWSAYFDLSRDYASIRAQISQDSFTSRAAEYGKGIRILRQDVWETLCTFIISQCNNIKRIRGIVERLCDLFGDEWDYEGKSYRLFPTPERMAALTEADLAPLRAGYRAAYLLGAARDVTEGRLKLELLAEMPTDEVIRTLTGLNGVGNKVACCVALFGVGKTDAFPVDVWVKRAIEQHYGGRSFDSAVFGDVAGIAQQYIFHYIRCFREPETAPSAQSV